MQLTPTNEAERSEILDVVRGFALLGVVVMNWYYAGVWDLLTLSQRGDMATASFDRVVQMLDMLLFEDKFYTLFSMLFGLGFALQLGRATSRGQNLIPAYVRRLTILLGIGIAHAILLFYGDVLHVYALLGFALILFRDRSDRVVLGSAIAIAIVVVLLPSVEALVNSQWPDALTGGGQGPDRAERLSAVASGGWRGVIWFNATSLKGFYSSPWDAGWYLDVFWKFLVGFWIGRRGLLDRAGEHLVFYRRLLPWALVIGLAGNGLQVALRFRLFESPVWLVEDGFAGRLISIALECAIPALALAYICILVLAYQRPKGRAVLRTLAPLGRMALTNYLMQGVVLVFLFFGVGLGLAGRVGIGIATLLAIATFLLQIVFSEWWLERFRFGPAEWAWRSLSYGRRMGMRRAPAA